MCGVSPEASGTQTLRSKVTPQKRTLTQSKAVDDLVFCQSTPPHVNAQYLLGYSHEILASTSIYAPSQLQMPLCWCKATAHRFETLI